MAKRKSEAVAPEVIYKRESRYYFPGRQVWHKGLKKLGNIVSPINVGWHEMWFVKFHDGEEKAVYEQNIVPFDYRNCRCGVALSVKYRDCPKCRWFVCPHCGRCGCRKGYGL